MKAHGLLYVADGAAAQSLTTSPALMTGLATAGPTSQTEGNLGVIPVVASDKIQVVPGRYRVNFSVSGIASTAGDVQANLRKGATPTEVAQGQCRANFATSNADNCMAFSTIVTLAESDKDDNGLVDLCIYLEASTNLDFTPIFAQFSAEKLD
jgi:hypothetical protein